MIPQKEKSIMKRYTKIYCSLLLIGLIGCDNVDFGETNVDPDAPTTVVSSGLLTNAEKTISSLVTDEIGDLYTQHISQITYTDGSRYVTQNWDSDYLYKGALTDLQTIINVNSDENMAVGQTVYGSNANQIAVARLIKAYIFQYMTDTWGMMPYSEALQGLDNPYPVFDTQEAIYDSLFTEIDEAIAQMDGGTGPVGDQLFGGDMERWKQFGNTMKLIMALRLSNVYPSPTGYAATKFKEAMSGAITSSDENILYPFLADDNNDNPWQDNFQTREDYAVSDVLIDRLIADSDPRLSVYAEYTRTSVSNGTPEYVGMPYGLPNSEILASDVSFISSNVIYNGEFPGMIYMYYQVAFSYAEAVELGWIAGSASDYYEAGITASFEYWGAEGLSEYLAAYPLSTDSATAMQQIAEEKWKALYLQGWESWMEWKRIGYPVLEPATMPLNGDDVPVRHGYDNDYPSNNTENYNAAVSAQGPDNLGTHVWWDTTHPITNQ
ncbi:SusD/RagB family nutrient-binding outer membrane lipoprotein [Flagellimonas pelagia]|uniref:SusD/RagB family nutrient-binding outer membrane lipoprotein n=2 Tax=Flagellimonas pelagia TaxID=2306998 RepID=A0A3A1NDZ2_9FLAO|nr:SusD/RagB family nutrient-binding outer membrane lipoprotein [Allomuricauda maritima]TXJ92096.1 SusD/RagB family nutrient-binding outer membrane lipoprotein [Allomuricauda maritima]